MRTTVTIDDELYKEALEYADPEMEKTELFKVALREFVRTQAARRLAALGGTMPDFPEIPRRQPEVASDTD